MSFYFPRLTKAELRTIAPITALSGLMGGSYGILHDLVTWSISNEYYTALKFIQFSWANLNFPPRYFAAEIGAIAGGSVGLGAGWILGRTLVTRLPREKAKRLALGTVAATLSSALVFAVIGNYVGIASSPGLRNSIWNDMATELQIRDFHSFVRVAFIHYGSYFGALLGIVGAMIRIKMSSRHVRTRISER